MKLILLLFWFLFHLGFSQTFPVIDLNFKNKLLQASPTIAVANNAVGDFITIDLNHNNQIEVDEAQNVYRLYVDNSNITNLSGLENFTNLIYLSCSQNNISNINLQQLINLEHLVCHHNQISILDMSTNANLKNLFCYNNQLSTLNFYNNSMLEVMYCGNNDLISLDFTNNPLFYDLGCQNNNNLTTINIKNSYTQIFGASTWLNQCWTGCPNLTTICADNNELNALQNYLDNCGLDTTVIDFESTCLLANKQFDKNEIVFYPNPTSSKIYMNSNEIIKNVAIIDVQGRLILQQQVDKNNATFDLSNYSNGVYFIKINTDSGQKISKIVKE